MSESATPSSLGNGQEGQQPSWLPPAREIQGMLEILTKEIYQSVPREIRAHHYREQLSGGTNWELTFWETGKHPAAGRMASLEVALGAIKELVFNADEESRPPAKMPKLARVRSHEEASERDGRAANEWQKATAIWRAARKEEGHEL